MKKEICKHRSIEKGNGEKNWRCVFCHKKQIPPRKSDFSAFFNDTTPEERKKVLEDVVQKANQDQKKMVDRRTVKI